MQILEQHLDENGNISVRISDRCVVLTDDEAEKIKSKFNKLRDETAKLRELLRDAWGNGHIDKSCGDCEIMYECHAEIEEAHKNGRGRWNTRCLFERRIEARMRDLGIDVDA